MSEIVTHRRTRQLKGQLTDLNLRNLTTRERPCKAADGNGLYVLVSPTGLRAWRWKYRFAGREKVLPLGSYPDVTLAEARSGRDEARKKGLAGIDPVEERQEGSRSTAGLSLSAKPLSPPGFRRHSAIDVTLGHVSGQQAGQGLNHCRARARLRLGTFNSHQQEHA